MKNALLINGLLAIAVFTLTAVSGCSAIEGIFKAGMWVGVIIVVAIVAIILFLVKAFGGK